MTTVEIARVSVIGLGYIGLPTAAIIANRGLSVVGVDIDEAVVRQLNQGQVHIVEPELDVLVHAAVSSGNFRAALRSEPSDVFLIAVPTPFKDHHLADLQYIEAASHSIAPVLRPGNLVILESTSPVGATEKMVEWLAAARPDLSFPRRGSSSFSDIHVAHCPERVLPGRILQELVGNDRVIGGMTPACSQHAIAFYKTFVSGSCLATDARTAEMTKLTENSFRDVNIAFANELSLVCERLNVNVWELIELANHHPRVNILQPGPGVGGHCIAVDPWFIVEAAPDLARLIRTAREVNNSKPCWVIEKVKAASNNFKLPKVACLGLAFKPDIDDLRESPALEIVCGLAEEIQGEILVVEPFIEVMPMALEKFSNVRLMDAELALREADVVVLLVNHRQFLSIDRELLEGKMVIDTRGAWR
jgi:UDP-N-acetyl-D-mannosaminuronic acid dehydrogenase